MKSKKLFLSLVFSLIILNTIGPQVVRAFTIPDDIPFFQLEAQAEILKQYCVWIKTSPIKPNEDWTFGSGFIVVRPQIVYVITCNHCVPRDTAVVSVNIEGGKREGVRGIVVARSPGKDAAVLVLEEPKGKTTLHGYGLSQFDTADTKNTELRDGAGVMILGFPLNIGATEKGQGSLIPVTRIGIVAYHSPQSITFLIDGFASSGNSGSPVISAKTGKLLGMVTSFAQDLSQIQDEKGKLTTMPYNSGLAQALTAKQIADLIKLADKNLK